VRAAISFHIGEAQARVKSDVKLPYDTHLEWGGRSGPDARGANGFCSSFATLVLIAFLVYSAVGGVRDMAIRAALDPGCLRRRRHRRCS